jgi:hypothetical protein
MIIGEKFSIQMKYKKLKVILAQIFQLARPLQLLEIPHLVTSVLYDSRGV